MVDAAAPRGPSDASPPLVSVVIRTLNEERWIGRTLRMIFAQEMNDLEVVVVDSGSSDHTLDIARKFPVRIIPITRFRPGAAINVGIRATTGRYVCIVSAHCVPGDRKWLGNLVASLEAEPKAAGVYGRQLPFSYSSDLDKRDLLITFGLDRRVQVKDHFFHNANSLVRREVWEQHPFDEELTNIEDRAWGKTVIAAGHTLVYEPLAPVFHYHGIHQARDEARAASIVRIMERIDKEDDALALPEGFTADGMRVLAVLPVRGPSRRVGGRDLIERALAELAASRYVTDRVVIAEDPEVLAIAKKAGALTVERPAALAEASVPVEEVIRHAIRSVETGKRFYDACLYVDPLYPFRPAGMFDAMVVEFASSGVDTIVPTLADYHPFWSPGDSRRVKADALAPRGEKNPVHRGLLGLGTITSMEFIRKEHLIGPNLAVRPVGEPLFALRASEPFDAAVIAAVFDRGEGGFVAKREDPVAQARREADQRQRSE